MSDSLNSACPQGDSEIEWFDLSTHNVVDEGPSHHGLFTRDKKKDLITMKLSRKECVSRPFHKLFHMVSPSYILYFFFINVKKIKGQSC